MRRTAGPPAGKKKRGSRIALLLIVALLAVGGVYAEYYVRTLTYYPTAKIDLPGGFSFSMVQALQPDRAACGRANRRVIEPMKKSCPECTVAYARCRRKIEGTDLLLLTEPKPAFYVVVAPGLRMRVEGPLDQLAAVCDGIAEKLANNGKVNASCLYPRDLPRRRP